MVDVTDAGLWLGGPLAVDLLATEAVGDALSAAAELAEARGCRRPVVQFSAEHAALSFRSERYALVGGEPTGAMFGPLSRIVRCAGGGWARTHANYPHHAAAIGRALDIDISAAKAVEALESAALSMDSIALEEAIVSEGGCAAAMRSAADWVAHPAGVAAGADPLITYDENLKTTSPRALEALELATRPAAGIRVLDLTRVIAGPVGGRTLAALGADVLRVDPKHLPEIPAQHVDTGPGKRAAELDLADAERREALLAGADVLLTGYRPGALARFGMGAADLAERHPHLVQVSLSAWGTTGPWATRRGFDSLVQLATGIASECSSEDGAPGVLPAQALDHATGHFVAGAALRGLAARARGEAVAPARLSLARTAKHLLDWSRNSPPRSELTDTEDPERHRVSLGDVSLIAPPGTLEGVALSWPHGPRPLGGDPPRWW